MSSENDNNKQETKLTNEQEHKKHAIYSDKTSDWILHSVHNA